MLKLAIPNHNHKNGNGPRKSDLASAIEAAVDAAELVAMRDNYFENEIVELRRHLCSVDARLAALQRMLAGSHTEQQKEREQ